MKPKSDSNEGMIQFNIAIYLNKYYKLVKYITAYEIEITCFDWPFLPDPYGMYSLIILLFGYSLEAAVCQVY